MKASGIHSVFMPSLSKVTAKMSKKHSRCSCCLLRLRKPVYFKVTAPEIPFQDRVPVILQEAAGNVFSQLP